jgi:hypothetical protein
MVLSLSKLEQVSRRVQIHSKRLKKSGSRLDECDQHFSDEFRYLPMYNLSSMILRY